MKHHPELDAATSLLWRRFVGRERYGTDIHITSDARRAVILKVDALLCRLRLQKASEAKEGARHDAPRAVSR
jgi:hypothetical protein